MSSDEDRAKKQREAGERESEKLWRAWRTVHEMVQDRGYELADEEVKIPLDLFKDKYSGDDGQIKYAQPSSLLMSTN
jgi:DNA-directed RNA polymerase I, II, and III subunit RPABC1